MTQVVFDGKLFYKVSREQATDGSDVEVADDGEVGAGDCGGGGHQSCQTHE